MKQFIILAMALLTFGSAAAQGSTDDVKKSIMDFMKAEGYLPQEDADGDIGFKSSGDQHYVRVYDGDNGGFTYVELFCIYTTNDTTVDAVARAVNTVNGGYQMVRSTYVEVEDTPGKFRVLFETPCYITGADEFNSRLREFLSCIDGGSDRFYEVLAEEPEDGSADVAE